MFALDLLFMVAVATLIMEIPDCRAPVVEGNEKELITQFLKKKKRNKFWKSLLVFILGLTCGECFLLQSAYLC